MWSLSADEDGVLVTQVVERRKGWPEHGVRGYIAKATLFVKLL